MIAKARHVFRTTWRGFSHNGAMFFEEKGIISSTKRGVFGAFSAIFSDNDLTFAEICLTFYGK